MCNKAAEVKINKIDSKSLKKKPLKYAIIPLKIL